MFLKGVFKGVLVNICLKNVLKNFDMPIHRAMFLGESDYCLEIIKHC